MEKNDKGDSEDKWVVTPALNRDFQKFICLVEKLYCSGLPVSHPFMIIGDTGVGKSLFVEAFKRLYQKAYNIPENKIVSLNIASLAPNIIESELFGHVRGAFTGADKDKVGFLKEADGGLLIVEEIGELSKENQTKLLTFIDDGYYHRLGSTQKENSSALIIGTTNRSGVFRNDFQARFLEFHIRPLSERRMDVLYYFLIKFEDIFYSLNITELLVFLSYNWPGNIRELEIVGNKTMVLDTFRLRETKNIQGEIEDKAISETDYRNSWLHDNRLRSPIRFSNFPYMPFAREVLDELGSVGVSEDDLLWLLKYFFPLQQNYWNPYAQPFKDKKIEFHQTICEKTNLKRYEFSPSLWDIASGFMDFATFFNSPSSTM